MYLDLSIVSIAGDQICTINKYNIKTKLYGTVFKYNYNFNICNRKMFIIRSALTIRNAVAI